MKHIILLLAVLLSVSCGYSRRISEFSFSIDLLNIYYKYVIAYSDDSEHPSSVSEFTHDESSVEEIVFDWTGYDQGVVKVVSSQMEDEYWEQTVYLDSKGYVEKVEESFGNEEEKIIYDFTTDSEGHITGLKKYKNNIPALTGILDWNDGNFMKYTVKESSNNESQTVLGYESGKIIPAKSNIVSLLINAFFLQSEIPFSLVFTGCTGSKDIPTSISVEGLDSESEKSPILTKTDDYGYPVEITMGNSFLMEKISLKWENGETGVDENFYDDNAGEEYYSIDGRRLVHPEKGINIIKNRKGKFTKKLIR